MTKAQMLKLHRWIGIPLALLLLVQALTGTALVFRDELEPVIHPALIIAPKAERLPMQVLLDRVRSTHPEMTVTRAELPDRNDQAVMFRLSRKGETAYSVAINPYDGAIVREGSRSQWPAEFLFDIHEQLLAGDVGETTVGIEGVLLLFLAITGPIAWWPGRKRIRQGLRVRLDAGNDARWRTLHRSAGAIAALFLILSATTGFLMVWKAGLQNVLGEVVAVDRKPTPKVKEEAGRTLLPVDALVDRAEAGFGPAELRQLRFSNDGRVVAVYLANERSIRPDGHAQFYFNAYDGSELGRHVPGLLPAATEFVDGLYTVHIGLWGGILTKLLLVVTGIALVGFALSGPWLWWSRTAGRRARKRQMPSAREGEAAA